MNPRNTNINTTFNNIKLNDPNLKCYYNNKPDSNSILSWNRPIQKADD